MPSPLKKLLFLAVVSAGAMLFGQFYLNGRPIADRLSKAVGQPVGYEIVEDTTADAANYAKVLGRKIPVWFTQGRVKLAKWLYPSVAGPSQTLRD